MTLCLVLAKLVPIFCEVSSDFGFPVQRDFNFAYVRLKVHCVAERTTCLIIISRDTALGLLNSDALRI